MMSGPVPLVATQLPADHDHDGGRSGSIHEFQSDQPSRIAATTTAYRHSTFNDCG